MALKLLRGTTAQVQAFTPELGEPVYDTDLNKLYIGDGVTPGGIAVEVGNSSISLDDLTDVDLSTPASSGETLVSDGAGSFAPGDPTKLSDKSIGDLSDVDITQTPPTTGQVLKWNGTQFIADDDESTAGTGLVNGATYPINIDGNVTGSVFADDDSTLLVDGANNLITGNVSNNVTTSKDINGGILRLSGTNEQGTVKAGISIVTDASGDDVYDLFTVRGYSDTADGYSLLFERARGTEAAPTGLQDEDEIGAMYWFGADTNGTPAISAGILATVAGTPGAGVVPGAINIIVSDETGTPDLGLGVSSNGIAVAANTVSAGVASGEVDDSAAVSYLKINVGGTDYAMPLFAIRP
jgi:hypothetical protein